MQACSGVVIAERGHFIESPVPACRGTAEGGPAFNSVFREGNQRGNASDKFETHGDRSVPQSKGGEAIFQILADMRGFGSAKSGRFAGDDAFVVKIHLNAPLFE